MGEDVIATSYWDSENDADAYHNSGYSGYKETLRILASVIEPRPMIADSEVISSTLH